MSNHQLSAVPASAAAKRKSAPKEDEDSGSESDSSDVVGVPFRLSLRLRSAEQGHGMTGVYGFKQRFSGVDVLEWSRNVADDRV